MAPLKTRVSFLDNGKPVADALARLSIELGSVRAAALFPDKPAGVRLACIALADAGEVASFGERLRTDLVQHLPREEAHAAIELTNRCMVLPLPLDTVLVVFLDIEAVEVMH